MSLPLSRLLLLSSVTLVACDDHDHDHDHGDDVFVELCEHIEAGPAQAVTAGGGPDSAPSVDAAHTRFDVTLADDGSGQFVGYLQRAVGSTNQIVALTEEVPYRVYGPDGTGVPMHHDLSTQDECGLVVSARHFEMPIGTVLIEFGPSSGATFSMVIEASDHGADGHE